jgi:methylated-DNA-[protein]-cysteine S-methyltransferase
MTLYGTPLDTPFGRMFAAVDAAGRLVEIALPNRPGPAVTPQASPPVDARRGLQAVRTQLGEYFLAKRRAFDLALRPIGSPFELRVWELLREIPYGATTSYGAVAAELGLTNGARAVGRANGANPLPIVVPCHRVVGSDGMLTVYGGGLPLKRALLQLEGAIALPQPRLF